MPLEPRPADAFTRGALLLGFSTIEFIPTGSSVGIPLGIIGAQSLEKEVETLTLERGDAGLLTVDREIISRFQPSFSIETFNFSPDLFRYIFGSTAGVAVSADAAAAASTNVRIPTVLPFESFLTLNHADINESSVEVTFQEIVSEAVGTGNGTLGGTQGDFSLDFKIKVIGDVTSFLVNGVEKLADLVSGSTPASGEIAIEVGEQDSPTTGSGAITFGSGEIPANGAAIVVTYQPSFSTTAGDIVNAGLAASADNDFVFDTQAGRIRFLREAADDTPFRTTGGEPLNVAYTYNRLAHTTFKPFTALTAEGSAIIRHLPDTGINFRYDVPSVTIRLTDDAIEFGAEDFARATFQLNLNDAGGSDRFGELKYATEAQSAA